MAQILDFVRTEKSDNAEKTMKFVVIFNIANHASLLAATLFTLTMREFRHNYDIQMVDIRDEFPRDADKYIWIDAGTPEKYEDVMRSISGTFANLGKEKAWVEALKEKSEVLAPKAKVNELSDSVFGAVSFFIGLDELASGLETGVEEADALPPQFLLMSDAMAKKLFVLSMAFEKAEVHHQEYSTYYKMLVEAYHGYHGKTLTHAGFYDVVWNAVPDTSAEFLAYQANITKSMSVKVVEDRVGNGFFHQVVSLGPDVWALLRRIKLSKKLPVHVSVCPLGRVVYTTAVLPEGIKPNNETLFLSPNNLE